MPNYRDYTITGRLPSEPELQQFGVDYGRGDKTILVIDFRTLELRALTHVMAETAKYDSVYFKGLELSPREFAEHFEPAMKKLVKQEPVPTTKNRHDRRRAVSLAKKK